MQFAQLDDITLHYRLDGRAGRGTIVLINSLGTDLRIWDDVVDHLADDFTLRYDKRGHGLSDLGSPPYAISDHTGDLIGLLDDLGIARAVFCGLSVGGLIAQDLYARAPERVAGLVFSNTAARIGEAEAWNQRIAAVEAGGIEGIAEGVLPRWFSASYMTSRAFPGYRNMLLRQPAQGYAGTCAAIRDFDMRERTGSIAVPTACIGASEDGATPPGLVKQFAASIPGATYHEIAGVGHLPCIEAPVRVSAIIRNIAQIAFEKE